MKFNKYLEALTTNPSEYKEYIFVVHIILQKMHKDSLLFKQCNDAYKEIKKILGRYKAKDFDLYEPPIKGYNIFKFKVKIPSSKISTINKEISNEIDDLYDLQIIDQRTNHEISWYRSGAAGGAGAPVFPVP